MKRTFKGACLMGIAWASMFATAQAGEVDWAALNPAFAKATYVKDKEVCVGCHAESIEAYKKTVHGRTFQYGPKGVIQARDCEACHGPRSQHVTAPDASLKFSTEQYSTVCLQCHQDGGRMYWQTSQHKTGDVGCVSCHTLMKKKSDKALLAKDKEPAVCYSCHTTVKGQMNKQSHHPVKEGKMLCSDCHNVHGSAGKSLLKGATINETCFKCHQENAAPLSGSMRWCGRIAPTAMMCTVPTTPTCSTPKARSSVYSAMPTAATPICRATTGSAIPPARAA